MESILDFAKSCVHWAEAKKIVKADPLVGNWACFDAEEMKKKFETGLLYKGAGANLFFFDLKEWAVEGQEVSLCEAKKYAEKHFPTKAAEEYYSFLNANQVLDRLHRVGIHAF
jgi:ribosomal protein L7/L12